jgi:hypothetical protein
MYKLVNCADDSEIMIIIPVYVLLVWKFKLDALYMHLISV